MMIRFARNTVLAALAGCGLFFGSCSNDDVLPDNGPTEVLLRMHIHTGLEAASRAGDDSDSDPSEVADTPSPQNPTGGFEGPKGAFETISTLRVIIIRDVAENDTHGHVEVNTIVGTDANGYPSLDDKLEFKILTGNKRIYLIANEDALPAPSKLLADRFGTARKYLGSISVNDEIDAQVFHNWIASAESDADGNNILRPMFSNAEGVGLPLTEWFNYEVSVTDPLEKEVEEEIRESTTIDAHFFLTRCPAKAIFNVKIADNISSTDRNNLGKISGVRLTGLDWEQYVFPRSAVYYPAKRVTEAPEFNDDPFSGGFSKTDRYITSFAAPVNRNSGARYQLTGLNYDLKALTATGSYDIGPIYFPESLMTVAGQNYQVQVQVTDAYGQTTWLTAQPLKDDILKVNGMCAIARNTCLKINITINGPDDLKWQAIEAPFNTSVLDPVFGLNVPENYSE